LISGIDTYQFMIEFPSGLYAIEKNPQVKKKNTAISLNQQLQIALIPIRGASQILNYVLI